MTNFFAHLVFPSGNVLICNYFFVDDFFSSENVLICNNFFVDLVFQWKDFSVSATMGEEVTSDLGEVFHH